MTTEKTTMTCFESPPKNESGNVPSQDSNTYSDFSTGSDGSSNSPPKKRPHVDYTSVENFDLAPFIERYGEVFRSGMEDILEKFGPDYLYELLLDPLPQSSEVEADNDKQPIGLQYAELVLKYLKDTKAEIYDFESTRSFFRIDSENITHFNFFASDEGSPKCHLFYAELDVSHKPVQVRSCSIVGSFDEYPAHVISKDLIVHPEGVSCPHCSLDDVLEYAEDVDCLL